MKYIERKSLEFVHIESHSPFSVVFRLPGKLSSPIFLFYGLSKFFLGFIGSPKFNPLLSS